MNEATFKLVMAIGVMLNSALYLSGCFIAGLVTHNAWAWRFSLMALGITYLSYIAQLNVHRGPLALALARLLVTISISVGFNAGLMLLG